MTTKRQFGVFVSVGLVCAVADVGTTAVMLWNGFHYSVAATFGFLLALSLNFAGHSSLSFQVPWSLETARKFGTVVLINYGLTLGFVAMSEAVLDSALMGKLVSIPVVAILGFLWSKYWVFK